MFSIVFFSAVAAALAATGPALNNPDACKLVPQEYKEDSSLNPKNNFRVGNACPDVELFWLKDPTNIKESAPRVLCFRSRDGRTQLLGRSEGPPSAGIERGCQTI